MLHMTTQEKSHMDFRADVMSGRRQSKKDFDCIHQYKQIFSSKY